MPIFSLISQQTLENIKIFLDINLNQIKSLFSKCEVYLNRLQIGDDDAISEISDMD